MTLIDDGNLLLTSTEINDITFLHADVKVFKKSHYKKYLVEIARALKDIKPVYSLVLDKKSQKLNEMFGFEPMFLHENYLIMEYK
jgi:hypothetical protein